MHEWDVEDGRERDGERLSEALNRAVGGVEPDLGPMVAAAAAQGRSLRRRRAGAAGAVAAVLALTVGVGAVQLAAGAVSGRTERSSPWPPSGSSTIPALSTPWSRPRH